MASIVVSGDTSGTITLAAPAVSGTTTLTLPATTGNIVTDTATQTLTNKTLTSPTINSLSSASATAFTLQSAGTTAVTIDTSQNVSINTTTALAKLTVNGNITPSGAPSSFWGLDYAPSSSSGAYVTIANNATYSFASGSGATFVYEDSGSVGAVMFMSVYGTTYTVWQSGTGYSNVPTTASKINFGYSAGAYYLENKTGSSKNLYVSNIRMRTGS